MSPAVTLTGAATVFTVADVDASLAQYRDVFGFDVTFQWGDPLSYVCLCRDEVALHLLAARQATRQPGHGAVCVFVRDVDAIYAELVANGAKTARPPQDSAYGMRDFNVTDLDGNQLTFGMAS